MEHMRTCQKEAEHFLQSKGVEGKVLGCVVTGSTAYNLANKDKSDYDYLGIYLADTKELLSLDSNIKPTVATLPDDPEPDFTLHEASSFCHLLLKESLYCDWSDEDEIHCYSTESWRSLKNMRKNFITKEAIEEHLSYAREQFVRHKKKGLPGKRIYHIVRLLYNCIRMLKNEDPIVHIPEGEERDLLLKIKTEELKNAPFENLVKSLEKQIEEMKPWNLPDKADTKLLDEWLVSLRTKQFLEQE